MKAQEAPVQSQTNVNESSCSAMSAAEKYS